MEGEIKISIDLDKYEKESCWDGLKGYLTNTKLDNQSIFDSYKELWHIEKAFRMSKTDLRIRPVYHRKQRRIEAHICIAFTAYCVYKELERALYESKSHDIDHHHSVLYEYLSELGDILPHVQDLVF